MDAARAVMHVMTRARSHTLPSMARLQSCAWRSGTCSVPLHSSFSPTALGQPSVPSRICAAVPVNTCVHRHAGDDAPHSTNVRTPVPGTHVFHGVEDHGLEHDL